MPTKKSIAYKVVEVRHDNSFYSLIRILGGNMFGCENLELEYKLNKRVKPRIPGSAGILCFKTQQYANMFIHQNRAPLKYHTICLLRCQIENPLDLSDFPCSWILPHQITHTNKYKTRLGYLKRATRLPSYCFPTGTISATAITPIEIVAKYSETWFNIK